MAASARAQSDSSDAGTRSTPLKRHGDRMLSAVGAVGGRTLLPTAWPRPPGAPSVQGNTSRPTTNALSRGARWRRATRAHTGRPNARIAGRTMGRGRTPVLPRGKPACPPGDGGHRPPHAGSGGRRGLCSLPKTRLLRLRPRSLKGIWARRRSRRRSGPPRKKWRSRGAGVVKLVFGVVGERFSFSFVSGDHGATTSDHSTKQLRVINDDPQHDRHSVKLSVKASSRLSKT